MVLLLNGTPAEFVLMLPNETDRAVSANKQNRFFCLWILIFMEYFLMVEIISIDDSAEKIQSAVLLQFSSPCDVR
jgi:hypothetical protein